MEKQQLQRTFLNQKDYIDWFKSRNKNCPLKYINYPENYENLLSIQTCFNILQNNQIITINQFKTILNDSCFGISNEEFKELIKLLKIYDKITLNHFLKFEKDQQIQKFIQKIAMSQQSDSFVPFNFQQILNYAIYQRQKRNQIDFTQDLRKTFKPKLFRINNNDQQKTSMAWEGFTNLLETCRINPCKENSLDHLCNYRSMKQLPSIPMFKNEVKQVERQDIYQFFINKRQQIHYNMKNNQNLQLNFTHDTINMHQSNLQKKIIKFKKLNQI